MNVENSSELSRRIGDLKREKNLKFIGSRMNSLVF